MTKLSVIFGVFLFMVCAGATEASADPATAGAGIVSVGNVSVPSDSTQDELFWAIIDAENHRLPDSPAIAVALTSKFPTLRAAAVRSLGRIANPHSMPTALRALEDRNPLVRKNAAFAVGMIGSTMLSAGDSAQDDLTAALEKLVNVYEQEAVDMVRAEMTLAIGRAGSPGRQGGSQEPSWQQWPELLEWMGRQLRARPAESVATAGAAQGLGLLFLRAPTDALLGIDFLQDLSQLASGNSIAAVPAAFALARYAGNGGDAHLDALEAAFKGAKKGDARGFLARALGRTKTPRARDLLIRAMADDPALAVRVDAARALGSFPMGAEGCGETCAALTGALNDSSAQVRVQALMTLEKIGPAAVSVAPQLFEMAQKSASTWQREAALTALAKITPDAARPIIHEQLQLKWPRNRGALAAIAGTTEGNSVEDLKLVLSRLTGSDLREATAAAAAAGNFADSLLDTEARSPFLEALTRPDAALTSYLAETAGRRGWKEFAGPLAEVYKKFIRADDVEVKVAVLSALGLLGDEAVMPLLETALNDDERSVVSAAAAAMKAISGRDVSDRIPAASRITAVTPSLKELHRATRARVRLETDRGVIVLRMLDSAPLTAANFIGLVQKGFYNGTTFHRIVPHFVAQGGDPRGDGYGGPGYLIRDEVGAVSHETGTVGIATAGKDTGGCQFFINHGPNLHLDGNYTVFARVESSRTESAGKKAISGMDVADQLEADDVIRRAIVLP